MHSADKTLLTSAIADGLARSHEAVVERCLADVLVTPDPLQKLVLCDGGRVLTGRLERQRPAAPCVEPCPPCEAEQAGIQLVNAEARDHSVSILARRKRLL
jgi:hypothetical protein